MGTDVAGKVVEGILAKPDIPISVLILLLVIGGLFYLLIRSYKQNDKIAEQLEDNYTLMSTLVQISNTDHETMVRNQDILQRFDVCLNHTTTQLNNLFNELRSHRDECNRKVFNVNSIMGK